MTGVPVAEPVPMKLRALPQSFWQQPNHTNSLSPGAVYPVLPPLSSLGATKEEVDSVAAGNVSQSASQSVSQSRGPAEFRRARFSV
jgi:hypothetical protein